MKIICKPCFAFDVLSAIIFYNWNHDGYSLYVKEQIEKHLEPLEGVEDMVNDKYIRFLLDLYSLEEIEKFDLQTLTEIFLNYFKNDELEKEFETGLKILNDMDFTRFWEANCLPVLNNLCSRYNLMLEKNDISGLLSDIQKLKPNEKMGDIKIYTAYFPYGVSMNLSAKSYLTNVGVNGEEIQINSTLGLLTHELTHGFPSVKIKEIYTKVREEDEFMQKCKSIQNFVTGNEEEYVVAVSDYISFKNGIKTKNEVFNQGDGSMAIAFIILNELFVLGEIPDDINSWIYDLFVNETIKVGEIENKIKSILPDYADTFMNIWFKDKI